MPTQPAAAPHERQFWREKQVIATWCPVHRATLWKWIRAGKFPKPVRLGTRTVAWRDEDLRAWAQQQQFRPLGVAA